MNEITSSAVSLRNLHKKVRAALTLTDPPPIQYVHPGRRLVTRKALDLIDHLVPEITATGSIILLDFAGLHAWRGSVELCEYRPKIGDFYSDCFGGELREKVRSEKLSKAWERKRDITVNLGDVLYSQFHLRDWGWKNPVMAVYLATPWKSKGVKIKPSSLPVLTRQEWLKMRGRAA